MDDAKNCLLACCKVSDDYNWSVYHLYRVESTRGHGLSHIGGPPYSDYGRSYDDHDVINTKYNMH